MVIDKMNKKGQIRIPWGGLDLISAVIFILGLIISQSNQIWGWILIAIAILKQFSGR